MAFFTKDLTTESGLELRSAHVEVTGLTVRYLDKKVIVDLSVWVSSDARNAGSKPVPDPRIPLKLAFAGEHFFDPWTLSAEELVSRVKARV